jgi:3-carboxy-cis,cis-muconate cycloisomerase
MVGRTLLQQALPITFGLKAAGWLTAIDAAGARLREAVDAALYVQLGGAAGTLASLGDRGIEVAALLAEELGLRMPVMPWHAQRLVLFEVATPFAGAAMVVGKIARDVTLLAQSEVREASEARAPGWGASSTMPHKHNPVSAVAALGCARRVPNLLATLATSGEQEHERAAGAWHAEWETFADLLRLTGSAAVWTRDLLGGLTIDEGRMRTTLDDAGPMLAAEHLAALLAPVLGRLPALEHVRDAVAVAERTARPLVGVVLEHAPTASALSEMGLDAGALARALDPARHLGSADAWITRALSAHEASRARSGRAP